MVDLSENRPNHFLNFLEVLENLSNSTAAAECEHTASLLEGEERRYIIALVRRRLFQAKADFGFAVQPS